MGCYADAFKCPIISGAIYCLPFYGQIFRKQLEMLISKSQLLCCDCEAVRSAILVTAWLLVMFVFLCFMQSFRPCRLCAFVTLTKITLLTQITIDTHKYNGGTHCIKHTAVNFQPTVLTVALMPQCCVCRRRRLSSSVTLCIVAINGASQSKSYY